MAMVFTLASHLKEALAALLIAKKEAVEAAEKEKERIAEEVRNRCPPLPQLAEQTLRRRRKLLAQEGPR